MSTARGVHLMYHTILQVLVGLLLGGGFALAWLVVVERHLLRPSAAAELLDYSPARWLYLRDTRNVENVVRFEWEKAREEARKRTLARRSSGKGKTGLKRL
ncbi:hypothetical protein BDK51DRAFT_49289 [Blyttiomyces helicus]|uniref:Uncharacterized protein n=1 Tax=Blyttiomyces helicus TaxID=388810 RepID=A0A4P9WD61_9FUNG|nr:hypothetical protein BDK51DRAFT_49289 [Blyttiomyces helicus]|eukprot:RKO90464.1 hypothetical protein BDK51DRAFT_49289 [Blyttiomyces helicus]